MYANTAAVTVASPRVSPVITIARYLRISKDDDTRNESNSIKFQRDMLGAYISEQTEFDGARIVDYVDDGVTGSHENREAYQRLLADVKSGAVDCIMVKDLSRIGRNLIDVDDLLMNCLVLYNVRFVAVNNGYDSIRHPLSNLELAVINLANQHYNQDLVVKSKSAKVVKMKRGEFLSTFALFGYKKSTSAKNKIEIDEEAAGYVRLIFSLAADGNSKSQIARILNAQDIPTPSEYKKKHGVKGGWKTADPNYSFWYNTIVGRILDDIRYIGSAINNRYMAKAPSVHRCVQRPADEWIIVPNAHEAIVTEVEFQRAHEAMRKSKLNNVPVDHIFHNKVKCPVCGHTLRRTSPKNPRFKCYTRYFTDHYDCPDCTIFQADIEKAVLASVRAYAATTIDREEMKLALIRHGTASAKELEAKIREEERAIGTLEASVTKVFTSFAAGKMSKDTFLQKKSVINDTIGRKRSALEVLNEQLRAVTEGRAAVETAITQITPLLTIETLDREIVDLLIDRVLVRGEKEIEIVWRDGVKKG